MEATRFAILATAAALSSAALASCQKESVQSRPTANIQTQERLSPKSTPPAEDAQAQALRAGCPMVVQGANVTVADTKDGVVLTFTTENGDVRDLQERVQHMAQMYEMHGGYGHMRWHHMGGHHHGRGRGGPGMGMGYMAGRGPMPAANATVTKTDKGAKLELRPTDPSQLGTLREHARWHQERMHGGACWMLQNQPATPSQGEQE